MQNPWKIGQAEISLKSDVDELRGRGKRHPQNNRPTGNQTQEENKYHGEEHGGDLSSRCITLLCHSHSVIHANSIFIISQPTTDERVKQRHHHKRNKEEYDDNGYDVGFSWMRSDWLSAYFDRCSVDEA